jgi:putative membrane protein
MGRIECEHLHPGTHNRYQKDLSQMQLIQFSIMGFLIQLLINAAILFLSAYIMPSVKIRNYGTAVFVAFVIGLLNTTIGLILSLPLNLITLGLLSFFVRLLVTAIIIRLVDKFFTGFEVRSFSSAVILAFIMAIAGTLLSYA